MSELPIQQPFTNLQLELLSLYARNVSDEELLQIRDMLARFFGRTSSFLGGRHDSIKKIEELK